MPLNDEFLRTMAEEHEFDFDYSVKCLEANRHNHITATYHLISKKQKRIQSLKKSIAEPKWAHSKKPVDMNQTMPTSSVSPKINFLLDTATADRE
jgi:hypothetical protein